MADEGRGRMRMGRLAALSVYWCAVSAEWSAIFITLLPLEAARLGGAAHKGTALGVILLAGALVNIPAVPVFGALSDIWRTRWGRRLPLLLAGTVGNILGLLALARLSAYPAHLAWFIAAFAVLELSSNLATAPYSALIPDLVPPAQRGVASGWLGLMTLLGVAIGGTVGLPVARWGAATVYRLFAALLALMLGITLLTVREPAPPPPSPWSWRQLPRALAAPFRAHDYRWVWLTRLLVMLGVYTVEEYVQYYLLDVVAGGAARFPYRFFGHTLATTAVAATAYMVLAILLGAALSVIIAGALSDRYGRKRLVYLSALLQTLAGLAFIATANFSLIMLVSVLFGLGYGAYLSVDWALASDVLPDRAAHAKDMGVWNVALILPQIIAAPLAGLLLDAGQHFGRAHGHPTLGYTIIFLLAIVYYVLGSVFIRNIRGVR